MSPRELLGVRDDATDDDVRAAFRRFAQVHHPDHGGDPELFRAGLEAVAAIERHEEVLPAQLDLYRDRASPQRLRIVWRRLDGAG